MLYANGHIGTKHLHPNVCYIVCVGGKDNIYKKNASMFLLISNHQQQPFNCVVSLAPPSILTVYTLPGSWHASLGPSMGARGGGHALVSTPRGRNTSVAQCQGDFA